MKKIVLLMLAASSLAASARALVVGAEVGYLTDAKEAYYSARLGYEFKSQASLTHELDVEVGYTHQKDSGVKGDFTPITLNYRLTSATTEKLSYYVGAGAGLAITKVSYGWSENDTSAAIQAFTGVIYHLNPAVSLNVGAKYIWIDDVRLLGTKIKVGDDVALGGGLNIKF